jgi:antitoxin (DNA-binding transcriptional repressor) of toxin-antitoxin stability system
MQKITATELARNLRAVLDRVRESGETYIVERGGQPIVQVLPTPGQQNAAQALA